jgi:hypothetical protein
MFLVGWLPDPPDQISIHTNFSLTQPPFSLSFSFLTLSPQLLSHNTGASPSAFSLSFTVTGSRHFFTGTGSRNFFTGTVKLSLLSSLSRCLLGEELTVTGWRSSSLFSVLSLGVCLAKNSPSRGGSRSSKISPDLVRSR